MTVISPLSTTLAPTNHFTSQEQLSIALQDALVAGSNCSAAVYQVFGPLNEWDVSRLTSLDGVFSSVLDSQGQVNLNSWDVSRVTSMRGRLQSSTDRNDSLVLLDAVAAKNIYFWIVRNVPLL
jgi:Mycoplasma protein of unknown function, DUF285